MIMQPVGDLVLIKADKPREKTQSGLLVQEDWKSLPPKGTVLAVGPEVDSLKPGDRVLFERYASLILENDERICQLSHIMATLSDEDNATRD